MALFRKDVLQAAEKLVAKGKIEAAIKEYKKVLDKNQGDTNTLNRVGDLYVRLRKNEDAVRYYLQTAEQYALDGFYVKAIAVYKKIHRIDPGHMDVHRRLAELYKKQGLVNDARNHYTQVAEHSLNTGDRRSAISIYEQLVELESDNPSHFLKLADLFKEEGELTRAMEAYGRIASLMLSHGQIDHALQVYERAMRVAPDDLDFVSEALVAIKEAGGEARASRLLTAAIENNPQAETLRSLVSPPEVKSDLVGSDVPSDSGAPPFDSADDLGDDVPTELSDPALPADAAAPAAFGGEVHEDLQSGGGLDPMVDPQPELSESGSFVLGDLDEIEGGLDVAQLGEAGDELSREPVVELDPPSDDEGWEVELDPLAESHDAPAEPASEIELDPLADLEVLAVDEAEPSSSTVDGPIDGPELDGGVEGHSVGDMPIAADPTDEEIEAEIDLSFDQIRFGPETTEPDSVDVGPAQDSAPDAEQADETPSRVAKPVASDLGVLDTQPEMEDRVQELISEADVFSKYGLKEKALDRLKDAAELDSSSAAALSRLVDLLLEDDKRLQVVERARQLHQATSGEGEDWDRVESQLRGAGYTIDGANISAPAVDTQTEYGDVSRESLPSETAAAMATLDVSESVVDEIALDPMDASDSIPADVEEMAPDDVASEPVADSDQDLVDGIDAAFDALTAASDGSPDISESFEGMGQEEADIEVQIVDDDLLGEGVMSNSELDVDDLREDLETFEAEGSVTAHAGHEATAEVDESAPEDAETEVAAEAAPFEDAPADEPLADDSDADDSVSAETPLQDQQAEVSPEESFVEAIDPEPAAAAAEPLSVDEIAPADLEEEVVETTSEDAAVDVQDAGVADMADTDEEPAPAEDLSSGWLGSESAPATSWADAPVDELEAADEEPAGDLPEDVVEAVEPAAAEAFEAPAAEEPVDIDDHVEPAFEATQPEEAEEPSQFDSEVALESPVQDDALEQADAVMGDEAIAAPDEPLSAEPALDVPVADDAVTELPVEDSVASESPPSEVPVEAEASPALESDAMQVESGSAEPPASEEESSTPSWLDETESTEVESAEDGLFDEEQSFFDLGAALRDELEDGGDQPAAESVPEAVADPSEQSLEQIVEGFKRGVSENIPQEDSDTHYNLGIAYREMMLLDEAIGEFQISAKDPRYLVDSCAMLGLCFREKGLPDLAVNWYQRALDSDHLTGDQRLSMLYDLGLTYESMENSGAAFDAFAEIYGNDTNFRDVAERVDRLRA